MSVLIKVKQLFLENHYIARVYLNIIQKSFRKDERIIAFLIFYNGVLTLFYMFFGLLFVFMIVFSFF